MSPQTDSPVPPATEAVLSLGSNQGDRLALLARACDALAACHGIRLTQRSPVYETDPVGVTPDLACHLYLNQAVIVETTLPPQVFSAAIHRIEQQLGRTRTGVRNLPRLIDIDIITYGDLRLDTPALTLPHPRARDRRFVLQPLADLRPDFIFSGDTQTVSDLLRALPPSPSVKRLP